MGGSSQLRNHSHSSYHCIPHYRLHVLTRILLGLIKSRPFGYLGMTFQNKGKGFVVCDVPMQDVHLVVHHCIDCFLNYLGRQIASGSVNHDPPVFETRIVNNVDW